MKNTKAIQKTRHTGQRLLVLALLACVLAGVSLVLWRHYHHKRPADLTSNQAGQHENVGNGSKGSTPNTSYTPPTTNNGITITPTTSGDQVVLVTKLVGYSDGSCSLSVTNGTKTTSQTADIIYAPNYSTCAGFTIPVRDLGTGSWNIQLSITSGGQTTSKTITYEVVP